MDREDIERNLGYLGQKLAERNMKVAVLLLGGALMITQLGNRLATEDIDVIISASNKATYDAIKQVIQEVANEKGLPLHWLNDYGTIAADQITRPIKPILWKASLVYRFLFLNLTRFWLQIVVCTTS